MIKSYLKIAWRNLIRHKSFSFINIGGLSIGIAACLLISLYVHYQLSFDGYHTKKDRIVRITNLMHTPENDNVNVALSPALLATALNHNYPEVELAVRFEPDAGVIKVDNQLFSEENVYKADAAVFKIFDYKFAEGTAAQALADPHSIVITKKLATKYFGNGNAIGKSLICNKIPCKVSAVLEDLPENSDLKISAITPADYSKTTKWLADDFSVYTFVLFKQTPDLTAFGKKLAKISKQDIQPELNKMGAVKYSLDFNVEPLTDVHFSDGKVGDTIKGDKQLVYIFSILSIVILLIALLNYINLSTARAAERAKEVGVRKVNGAIQSSLVGQFLFESFFITLLALVIAVALTLISLPFLNSLLQIKISFWSSSASFMIICGLVLASSLLTGLYPAFVLSAFQPITALKGNFKHGAKGLTLRKVITITQFVIATVMIAGAFIMNRQINFVQHRSLGYDQNQVLSVSLPPDSVALQRVLVFNNALNEISQVKGTSVQSGLAILNAGQAKSTTMVTANGVKRELMSNYFSVDDKFIPLLKVQLDAGRNFSEEMATDKKEGFIVNEAFVKQVGWKKPIGQAIEGFDHKGHVVGVIKDFHYASMHNPIAPLVMVYTTFRPSAVLVKISPENLQLVKNVWQSYFSDYPFTYDFMDSSFNVLYQKDVSSIKLFNYFTLLSIFLACLGLYGLAHLIATQRTKEIGIRKVLGAALNQLLVLLAKDFVKLIAIAAVLAIPITLLVMNKWLATYAYHISINWWLLVSPVFVILLISILVIGYQTIKVAVTNPVKSLKSE
ncbi:ABC transporter permease [Mucilaginibacter sp. BJC16-A38]|uniref:ABC transporter permease n=1 Tax=Mucilaginibacter phenanthrenivorans TaxID=1234842 RepID=UPI002157FBD4|nr:ABC transporter permease [Mucilaginibacter phenanthrenivorans]MCR8559783.1 ABC transporter permease [Mucilaginibacter phenanthrenivorans]